MRRIIIVCLAALLLFSLAGVLLAEITVAVDPVAAGVGARPLGLGRAFLAETGDPAGIFLNPAGLASLKSFAASSMSGKLLNEYNYTNFSLAFPVRVGVLGLGYVGSGISFVAPAGTFETRGGVRFYPSSSEGAVFAHGSNALLLAYALPLKRAALGAAAKFYFGNLSGPTITDGYYNGFNVDAGLWYAFTPALTVGAALQNFLPGSLGRLRWGDGVEEALSSAVKAGLRFKAMGEGGWRQFRGQNLSLFLDAERPLLLAELPVQFHAGAEWQPVKALDIRFGLDQDAAGQGGTANNLTAGLGLNLENIRFDYAYHRYAPLSVGDSHYFSLTFWLKDHKGEPLPIMYPRPLRRVLKTADFADVNMDYWARQAILELKAAQIALGYPDGKFQPEREISRAEFATLIARGRKLSGAFQLAELPPDVTPDYWAAYYISEVLTAGIMETDEEGDFLPDWPISRAEAVVSLVRFAGLPLGRPLEAPYDDVPGRYPSAREITAAKEAGLLTAFAGGKLFQPDKPLSRAEAAEIVAGTARVRDFIEKFYAYEEE